MVINVNAQTNDFACGYDFVTDDSENFNQESIFSHSTDPNFLYAKEPIVLRVLFWQVNQYGGQFGDDPNQNIDITEQEALSAIANLNMEFNQYNIFFKYKGLNQFDSPETIYIEELDEGGYNCAPILGDDQVAILDENGFNTLDNHCQFIQLFQFANSNGYMPKGHINIYIPHETHLYRAVGATSLPKMIIKREDFANKIMIHEMGHVLYLKHTHKGHRDIDDPLNDQYTACEHVTRDPANDDYNAELKGDIIVDTAAAPDFLFEHYYELLEQGYSEEYAAANDTVYKYIAPLTCDYIGTGLSCLDNLYDIYESDSKNIMAYIPEDCRESFTIGQAIRMHEIVELWPENYEPTTLSELFEPYSGEYYFAGPLPTEHPPLFQPGFKYKFVECEGPYPAPAAYGTVFPFSINTILLTIDDDETDYTSITHPNHSAILIKHDYGDFLDKPEKCYDNWNRKPSGGLITKFNDDVFNTNVTFTAQDSTSINNQSLIENLESGLYKIDKIYEDGSSQETVIYKENN